jgi:CRP-like cAMP-binding protein
MERIANPFIVRLSRFVHLHDEDIPLLKSLCLKRARFGPGDTLVAEGEPPRPCFAVISGTACRFRLLGDGRRQILTLLIPGDFYDLHAFLLDAADHSVGALTPVCVALMQQEAVSEAIAHNTRIAAALWWSAMQEAAMLRERVVALGRRDARGRVAYLLCEFLWRHMAVGLAEGHTVEFPLRQHEIADALGLTPVHVNRVLQEFRASRLITLDRRRLTIHDVWGLQARAELSPDYLMGTAPQHARVASAV